MKDENKVFLLIDGDYFCHRSIHGIRIGQPDFTLSTPSQKEQYLNVLKNSVLSLYEGFGDVIYNMIFVFDNHSWRKDIPGHRPYYLRSPNDVETVDVQYKANRKKLRDTNDIDYDAFDICKDEFADFLNRKTTIPTYKMYGFEGDDMLLMISKKINSLSPNNYCCIFATDGDLQQIVDNQTILFRNSKSKENPDGKIYISAGMYNTIYDNNPINRLTDSNDSSELMNRLFSVNVNSKYPAIRQKDKDIFIADPLLVGWTKVICGDKKDNIFSLIGWNKAGRNYNTTEKMLIKAFGMSMYDFNNRTVTQLINNSVQNKDELNNIFYSLFFITKQDKSNLPELQKHYDHNYKVIMLNKDTLPKHLIINFNELFDELKDRTLQKIDMSNYNRSVTVDSSVDISKNSIPDFDIDDILNKL